MLRGAYSSMSIVLGFVLVVVLFALVVYAKKHGHSKVVSDIVVGSVIFGLAMGFALLEAVNLMIWPFRYIRRLLNYSPPMDPKITSDLSTGRHSNSSRKIVVFDGVCVLCNRFGRFVLMHLPDANLVSFVPFQDPMSNPHVNLKKLQEEFKFDSEQLEDRIAVIEGETIKWGPDAVMTILSWCYFPFPVAKIGFLIPYPVRDALYLTVAKNRYRFFGTQALDQNFAKNLCPYLFIKNTMSRSKNE